LLWFRSKSPNSPTVRDCFAAPARTAPSPGRNRAKHAAHFALHDLTHYAVETALGYRRGFFGLIAEGWDIEETTGETPRGSLPPEALEVERIVGLLDSERASGTLWSAEEFSGFAPRVLSETEIQKACARSVPRFSASGKRSRRGKSWN
jgi:hypothetical protein